MADIVSPADRSLMMSGIRGKDTKPEIVVRKALFAAGFRFRLHRRDLPGRPDVALPGRKVVIFAHGCFWHRHTGCNNSKLPSTRPEFWLAKLQGNMERDRRDIDALLATGWRALVVWECATRDPATVASMPTLLAGWIEGAALYGEMSALTPA